jgi:hypothetical protein
MFVQFQQTRSSYIWVKADSVVQVTPSGQEAKSVLLLTSGTTCSVDMPASQVVELLQRKILNHDR